MRVLVIEGPRPEVEDVPQLDVMDLVREAAELVDEPVTTAEIFGTDLNDPGDVVVAELGSGWHERFERPTIFLDVAMHAESGPIGWPPDMPDHLPVLRFAPARRDAARAYIAAWLTRHSPHQQLTDRERQMIEVLAGEIRKLLDSGQLGRFDPEEVAQAQAAVETMEAQLRAPRPSRRVLRWAVSQIPGFTVGLLGNVAAS